MSELMSVKEARKLLGKNYAHSRDEDIEDIVEKLSHIARLYLEDAWHRLLQDEASQEITQ